METSTLPVSLCIADKPALVVGGGKVAARRTRWLLDAGAFVEVLAADFLPFFEEEKSCRLKLLKEPYSSRDLQSFMLAAAATDDPDVNRLVYEDAKRSGIPVNVADAPELCTFFVPSTLRRGSLSISVGTGGASPALAGRIKRDLGERYPESYTVFLDALCIMRDEVKDKTEDTSLRQKILGRLAEEGLYQELRSCNPEEMLKRMREVSSSILCELSRSLKSAASDVQ